MAISIRWPIHRHSPWWKLSSCHSLTAAECAVLQTKTKRSVRAEAITFRAAMTSASWDNDNIHVETRVQNILGWPTDTVEIDYINAAPDTNGGRECSSSRTTRHGHHHSLECPHTIFVFVPGNPGLVGWYIPTLLHLVRTCGRGFAARGVSYAGHGLSDDITDVERWMSSSPTTRSESERDTNIPWTVDGQIQHKVAYLDLIATQMDERRHRQRQEQNGSDHQLSPKSTESSHHRTRYIWLGHSIGCHMIQRLLVLRPDILKQTDLVIHLMPFNRMDAPRRWQWFCDTLSSRPGPVIRHAQSFMRLLAMLPVHVLDTLLKGDIQCDNGRKIAVDLLQQPHFGRNFLELGSEEVRDVPEVPDVHAYRIIGSQCPLAILFAGQDNWAPEFHMTDILTLQAKGVIPSSSIHCTYLPHLVHDFPVRPPMVVDVNKFCMDTIESQVLRLRRRRSGNLQSML